MQKKTTFINTNYRYSMYIDTDGVGFNYIWYAFFRVSTNMIITGNGISAQKAVMIISLPPVKEAGQIKGNM